MAHPIPIGEQATVSITETFSIVTDVKGYVLNEVDQAYHYHLETQFNDGNNAATVQLGDVHQSLILLPPDK